MINGATFLMQYHARVKNRPIMLPYVRLTVKFNWRK